jgi:hypothetical protein
MCRIHASGLSAACLASSPGSDVNEEGPDFQGDRDVVEEEVAWGVHTPGGGICRVFCAWDISCVYHSIVIFRKLEDAMEDIVGGSVGTRPFPPAFDNPAVVPIYEDMLSFECEHAYANDK